MVLFSAKNSTESVPNWRNCIEFNIIALNCNEVAKFLVDTAENELPGMVLAILFGLVIYEVSANIVGNLCREAVRRGARKI